MGRRSRTVSYTHLDVYKRQDLACTCDIRIAAESAKFACSFIKVGIVPGDGGAWLLPVSYTHLDVYKRQPFNQIPA